MTDEQYENEINRLIPTAVREAKGTVKLLGIKNEIRPGKEAVNYNHDFFSEFFHREMQRLAIKNGLRRF